MTTTEQPDVIARYLTTGGATVDINQRGLSRCAGCGSDNRARWFGGNGTTEALARDWAQAHAEDCRAMPKPENDR